MESAMSIMRLVSQHRRIKIAEEFWTDLLDWAETTGWNPEHPRPCYQPEDKFTVSAVDARSLAEAFDVIAGDLILHQRVSERFLVQLMNGFETMILFLQAGKFRIERISEAAPGGLGRV